MWHLCADTTCKARQRLRFQWSLTKILYMANNGFWSRPSHRVDTTFGCCSFFTFTKAIDVHAKVILAALAIHQLAESIYKAIGFLLAIIGLIGQIDFHATLHTFRNAVGHNALCKESDNELVKGMKNQCKNECGICVSKQQFKAICGLIFKLVTR